MFTEVSTHDPRRNANLIAVRLPWRRVGVRDVEEAVHLGDPEQVAILLLRFTSFSSPPWLRTVEKLLTSTPIGVLVSFTSVGSGSLIVATLLLMFPRERLNKLVGSDVFHGMLLVGVAAFGHWHLGDVNVPLVGSTHERRWAHRHAGDGRHQNAIRFMSNHRM
jgi:hypothetical protein